jgi:lysyl-tRNA synthetase class 2
MLRTSAGQEIRESSVVTQGTAVTFGGRVLGLNRAKTFTTYFLNLNGIFARVILSDETAINGERPRRGDIVAGDGLVDRVAAANRLSLRADRLSTVRRCAGMLPNKQYFRALQPHATVQAMFDPHTYMQFAAQARVLYALRTLLYQDGFVEVRTPILNASSEPTRARPFAVDYHDKRLYLKKVNESRLKLWLLSGFERVYEISSVFRNEGKSPQLLPEFTNLDAIMSWTDYAGVRRMAIRLVETAAEALGKELGPVVEYTIDEFGLAGTREEQARVFKRTIAPKLPGVFVVQGYPASTAPTAAPVDENPETSQELRLFINGTSCVHGYMFNDSADRLLMTHHIDHATPGADVPACMLFEEHVVYGMPPSGGVGIGLEKMLQLLCGMPTINHVQFFR